MNDRREASCRSKTKSLTASGNSSLSDAMVGVCSFGFVVVRELHGLDRRMNGNMAGTLLRACLLYHVKHST